MDAITPLSVRPVAETFVVEVTGMPVRGDVDPVLFRAFVDILHRHRVVLIRGLDLDPADQVAFSRRFGALEIHARRQNTLPAHPEVFCVGNVERDGMKASFSRGVEQWHADSSYRTVTSDASLFYGEIVPPEGGDTWFADATAAYDALPAAMKQRIDPLRAVHALETLYGWGARHNPHRAAFTDAQRLEWPPVSQPFVRVHPVTGVKSLYLCPAVISHIEDIPAEESRALIEELTVHATQPRFVYRHKWEKGDLVIWDNRAVLHTASLFDHERYQRLMYRTTVAGGQLEPDRLVA